MTEVNDDLEAITTTCPGCNKEVISLWKSDATGCIPSSAYVLIADWVFHSKCWDDMVTNAPDVRRS